MKPKLWSSVDNTQGETLWKGGGAQEVQKANDFTEKHLKSFAPCVISCYAPPELKFC